MYSGRVTDAPQLIEAADAKETQLPVGAKVIEIEQESQDPYCSGGDTPSYNPVSKD